ncbi:MAG: cation-transporting P-type ATPase [Bacillota bacterium]
MREAFLEAPEVIKELGSTPNGLASEEAARRLREYGPNVISEGHPTPLYKRLLPHLTNLLAILLWIAGVLAFVGGMPQLAYAVFAVILINAFFSFIQEYKAERASHALKNLLPRITTAVRDGQRVRLNVDELVPGDLVVLESGDAVPADARVLESASLLVNNSSLTGESEPVGRNAGPVDVEGVPIADMQDLIFMGTSVANGTCQAIVIRTGGKTEFGKVARLTQEVTEHLSPLQKQIARVTKILAVLATAFGGIFFALGLLIGRPLLENFLFAIGVIVANVPEGLLPTVTLALAMGMQRMARRNALVKKLTAVETLGSTTVILTDKTGTLTQNRMTVTRMYLDGSAVDLARAPEIKRGPSLDLLVQGMVLANNARITDDGFVGDPTEAALLFAARDFGADLAALYRRYPRIYEIPFDSRRKRMTGVHRIGGTAWALCKGAPGEVIPRCSDLDDAERKKVLSANDEMAKSGLRVLAFARRQLDSPVAREHDEVERDMAFVGLVGMFDPPRPEVAAAVDKAHTAGIRVIMVTGDYGLTAESIARRVGMVGRGRPRIITGTDLSKLDEEGLSNELREEQDVLFARVSPEDKMKIARALQRNGDIVAVTGDGVNDAPALKAADIGVAMGREGTDVAKEAADMVLTDDNFASIVSAVEEGRTVYANIRKFVTYILASNVPELVPYLAYVLLGVPLPLTVMQILAVDLGTDLLPALALGLEPPEPGVMQNPPRSKKESLLDAHLLARAYGFLGLMEAAIGMTAFFWFLGRHGWVWGQSLDPNSLVYRQSTSMVFTAIVVCQVFNVFAARTDVESVFRVGLFRNRWVWLGILWELGLTMVLLNVPVFQGVFGTAPLTLADWGFLWAISPLLLVAEEVRKWLVRRKMSRK